MAVEETAGPWHDAVRSLTDVHRAAEQRASAVAATISELNARVAALTSRIDDLEHEAALNNDPSILDLVGDSIRQLAAIDKRVRLLERQNVQVRS